MNNKNTKAPRSTQPVKPGYKFVGGLFPDTLQAALEEYARSQDLSVSQALRRIVKGNSGIKEALRQSRTP